jgi:hypothetical protein
MLEGRNFLELVRDVEAPFAYAEGHPDLAGKYEGLPAQAVLPPSRHFLGEPSEALLGYGEKIALFECECGCPGCWPLLVRIILTKKTVCWLDFEQPHRRSESPGSWWRYDTLGPFTFDRDQYESGLALAAAEFARLS